MDEGQSILLKIVESWDISATPEYRGFRCAVCQRPIFKAWHHWLTHGGYATPVHLCRRCEPSLSPRKILPPKPNASSSQAAIARCSDEITGVLIRLLKASESCKFPEYRSLTCDRCGRIVRKAYHLWCEREGTKSELHMCKYCGNVLGLSSPSKNEL
jgi:hypothetical protein